MPDDELNRLINTIRGMQERGVFKKYIDYIRFPYFRNLEENTKITFDFPLTVFVGPNGSGKSSTLHALWGASHKKTPYDFWFSTAVDPIQEVSGGGKRHSLIYAYTDTDNVQKEVLKIRIRKRNNPDYWETSRPILDFDMESLEGGKRNPPLYDQKVVYLDFRAELSAFDKYFYFRVPGKYLKSKRKQDYLRKKSPSLKKVIDGMQSIIRIRGKQQNAPLKIITDEELQWISTILNRKYVSGKVVYHKFFEDWGISIIFTTNHFTYSEAFAGSGEMAVERLVHKILNAPKNSLILLDEPEVSLHPGAQKRLKVFLLNQIVRKKLQIIISTHSPIIIDELPSESIKVFSQLSSGKFHLENEKTPSEAFLSIGHTITSKKLILVEDKLAKEIMERVVKDINSEYLELFDIIYLHGGATVLNRRIATYSEDQEFNKFVLFDGDQLRDKFEINQILEVDRTVTKLEKIVYKITDNHPNKLNFSIDGNKQSGGNERQYLECLLKFIDFHSKNVFYLPHKKPEQIIWNDDFFEKSFSSFSEEMRNKITEKTDYKERYKLISEHFTGTSTSSDNFMIQKSFLTNWLKLKNGDYNTIKLIIEEIKRR